MNTQVKNIQASAFQLPLGENGNDCPGFSETNPPTPLPTNSPTSLPTTTLEPTAMPSVELIFIPTTAPTLALSTTSPTTASPTTLNPTTKNPSTESPATQNPSTASPTTLNPTTLIPTQTPTNAPTQAPTQISLTLSPTSRPTTAPTSIPTNVPTQVPTNLPTQVPTNLPTQAPTNLPTQAPTNLPTQAPTRAPSLAPTATPTLVCTSDKYQFDGSCNLYNNRNFSFVSTTPNAGPLPSISSITAMIGHPSNADRGRSRLSVLAIAYARFFLSDVLEVNEVDMVKTPLSGCSSSGMYGKLVNTTKNYQTPVMDLSQVFGNSHDENFALQDGYHRLLFDRVQNGAAIGGHTMLGRGTNQVFRSGSANSNVDHFSIYLHARFFQLHNKFIKLLSPSEQTTSPAARERLFQAARLFVVMVAETISRDLARELGTLPNDGFDLNAGIPAEFLLMFFTDRFPVSLVNYGEAPRMDDYLPFNALCGPSPVDYESTSYNITSFDGITFSEISGIDSLAWVGYSAMYTRARNGGFLSNSSRCLASGVGLLQNSPFDPVATLVQRGRDHLFPTCQAYRLSKGLPNVTFSSFGNSAFADVFAAQYGNDFSKVELSVCMLLDSDLRDQMMGSLILRVLQSQNSSSYCTSSPQFVGSVVALLTDYPKETSMLRAITNSLCRGSPKVDLRGLVMSNQLTFISDAVVVELGLAAGDVDHFIACTTGNPFLAANAAYEPARPMLKEGSTQFLCDWRSREPQTPGQFLENAPRCTKDYPPTQPLLLRIRRCFCSARDGCNDHGFVHTQNVNCTCDTGFVASAVSGSNAFCERNSYAQTRLNQFSTIQSQVPKCSAVFSDSPLPAESSTLFNHFTRYCQNTSCIPTQGHFINGACNSKNVTNGDLGRVGSLLGRIVPANYPNGINAPASGTNWASIFTSRWPTPAPPVLMVQTALFRGMGKLLLDDMFSTSSTIFNEDGLHSGSDASNPNQFKNLVTSWVDGSLIYPSINTIAPYTEVEFGASQYRLTGFPASPVIIDESELALRNLFAKRYNQIHLFVTTKAAPCNDASRCNSDTVARCVREIAIQEFLGIAKEFLAEAKTLFPNAKSFPKHELVSPVELAGAQIFDLHWAPVAHTYSACTASSTNPASFDNNPLGCISTIQNVALSQQRNLLSAPTPILSAINASAELVKTLGLGSINAYLDKLGAPQLPHPLSNNLLLDLRNSTAEYAFNFGILENILAQDEKSTQANITCFAGDIGVNWENPQQLQWRATMADMMNFTNRNTLCKLFLEMSLSSSSRYSLSAINFQKSMLRPNMFRTSAGQVSGGC